MNRSPERQRMRNEELIFVSYEKRMENVHFRACVKEMRQFFRNLASQVFFKFDMKYIQLHKIKILDLVFFLSRYFLACDEL